VGEEAGSWRHERSLFLSFYHAAVHPIGAGRNSAGHHSYPKIGRRWALSRANQLHRIARRGQGA
jgi:hypothetical protein